MNDACAFPRNPSDLGPVRVCKQKALEPQRPKTAAPSPYDQNTQNTHSPESPAGELHELRKDLGHPDLHHRVPQLCVAGFWTSGFSGTRLP